MKLALLFYNCYESHVNIFDMWAPHQLTVEPLDQTLGCGVRDLAAQILPFLCVHHLQDASQVFQKVKRPQAAHEGGGGRLAVEHAVGVVQSLGTWGGAQQEKI